MSQDKLHKISRLRWQTTFDDKKRGTELQSQLGLWSQLTMPKETRYILDQICPFDTTLKINHLELDFGEIDYENLQETLSQRLQETLSEKLLELIMYPHKRGNNLEILNKKHSEIQILSHFLIHGSVPWDFNLHEGSLDQRLAYQLKTHKNELLLRIRTLGAQENVRKRLAWQFKEKTLSKLVKGLEPYNHTQVLTFTEEINKIQHRETVVKSSTYDFRKNVWLWVLNYLLVDRGSIFNRINFLENTLEQMAAHYNVRFQDLLRLIETAVLRLKESTYIKPGFIEVLKLLIKRNASPSRRETEESSDMDSACIRLENLLLNTVRTKAKRNELNELLMYVSSQNPQRLFRMLSKLKFSTDSWTKICQDLDTTTYTTLLSHIDSSNALPVLACVNYLDTLQKSTSNFCKKEKLQALGIEFLLKNTTHKTALKSFLEHCLTYLAKNNSALDRDLFQNLKNAPAPSNLGVSIKIHQRLISIYRQKFAAKKLSQNRSRPLLAAENTLSSLGLKSTENPHQLPQKPPRKVHIATKESTYTLKNGLSLSKSRLIALIENLLNSRKKTLKEQGYVVDFKDLFVLGLELAPKEIRNILAHTRLTKNQYKRLKAAVSLNTFCTYITSGLHNPLKEGSKAVLGIWGLLEKLGSPKIIKKIQSRCWDEMLEMIQTNSYGLKHINALLSFCLEELKQESGFQIEDILQAVKYTGIPISPVLKKALLAQNQIFAAINPEPLPLQASKILQSIRQEGRIAELFYHILVHEKLPNWFHEHATQNPVEICGQIGKYFPVSIYQCIKYEALTRDQLLTLSKVLPFTNLIQIIIGLQPHLRQELQDISRFFDSLAHLSFPIFSAKKVQFILYKLSISVWKRNNWRSFSPSRIWQELIWEICAKKGIAQEDFFLRTEEIKSKFPTSFQLSLIQLSQKINESRQSTVKTPVKEKGIPLTKKETSAKLKAGISLKNAGLVLMNNYIQTLFNRLGLLNKQAFIGKKSQLEAVHYLQYLATGLSNTDEYLLSLNKVLCGIRLDEPVPGGIKLSKDQDNLIEGLLKAVITHWPAIGSSSPQGFRGNWLVREGLLSEKDDRWELRVEKRPYDLLIHKSPFSFSIIKYAWMNKPLHVTWPY